MPEITLDQLSPEQIELLKKQIKEKDANAAAAASAKKQAYLEKREMLIASLMVTAIQVHSELKEFKSQSVQQLEEFREVAKEYADIRSDSKGGFSLRSLDGNNLVRLDRNVVYEYDERADQALILLHEFLEDTVKKRDKKTYRALSTLLARNKAGDLHPANVAKLMAIKDNWEDERWIKALDLLKEAYREREVSYSISFYQKDAMGKDQWLSLNFSSL